MRKGRTRATKDTYEDSRSIVFSHSRRGRTAGLEKGSLICFYNRKEASALKTVGICHNKTQNKTKQKQ